MQRIAVGVIIPRAPDGTFLTEQKKEIYQEIPDDEIIVNGLTRHEEQTLRDFSAMIAKQMREYIKTSHTKEAYK